MKNEILSYIKDTLIIEDDIDLNSDDDLLETGLVDSMGMMRLIGFLEDTYDVSVPPEDMIIENFVSVDAMADYLSSLRGA